MPEELEDDPVELDLLDLPDLLDVLLDLPDLLEEPDLLDVLALPALLEDLLLFFFSAAAA